MRKRMSWIVVAGEVLVFGLAAAAVANGQEYPALRPTYVPVSQQSANSPYAASQPVRVSMTNRTGQVTTLEYRQPVKVVSYNENYDDGLVPVSSLPVLSTPAREQDLVEMRSDRREVRYLSQPTSQPTSTSLPIVQTAGTCYRPGTVVNYAPAPSYTTPNYATTGYAVPGYTVPGYSVPNYVVPQTTYRPLPGQPVTPVVDPNLQVAKGIYGQPTIYRPGQPVRNALRYLTP